MSVYLDRSDVFQFQFGLESYVLKIQVPVNKANFALQEAIFVSVKITHLYHKLDFLDSETVFPIHFWNYISLCFGFNFAELKKIVANPFLQPAVMTSR